MAAIMTTVIHGHDREHDDSHNRGPDRGHDHHSDYGRDRELSSMPPLAMSRRTSALNRPLRSLCW